MTQLLGLYLYILLELRFWLTKIAVGKEPPTRLLDEESDYCVQTSNIRTYLEFSLDLRKKGTIILIHDEC